VKSYGAVWLALLLLLGTLLPAHSAKASSASGETIEVYLNQQQIAFPDAKPYAVDNEVMLPVLYVLEQLGAEVNWHAEREAIDIYWGYDYIELQAGDRSAGYNGYYTPFDKPSLLREARLYVPESFFRNIFGFATKYDAARRVLHIDSGEAYEELAREIVNLLVQGEHAAAANRYFDAELLAEQPVAQLQDIWTEYGVADLRTAELYWINGYRDGDHYVAVIDVDYGHIMFETHLWFDEDGKVAQLEFNNYYASRQLPAGVKEETVEIAAASEFALGGTLTMPEADHPVPAVVLLHGMGPYDRDSSVGNYRLFRDLAWGLAEQGIAVLRYDKRTYTYGYDMSEEEYKALTVKEEVIDDAIAAAELLRQDARVDGRHVYVIGHDLGGSLVPRLQAEGGGYAGAVLMAASARPLWETLYDQYQSAIERELDDADMQEYYSNWLEEQRAAALRVPSMTDEQLADTTIFDVPAPYFLDLERHSIQSYVQRMQIPVLVLQGGADLQLDAELEMAQWKEELRSKPQTEYALYPGLNHYFMRSEGEYAGTYYEYYTEAEAAPEVIDDIAVWIRARAGIR